MGKTYVSLKCDVKDLFDKNLKSAVLKALGKAVTTAVNANSKFTTTSKSQESIDLIATVLSISADNKDNPSKLEAKVSIEGTLVGKQYGSFKAAGNAKMDGTNPKRLEADAADLVDSVVSDVMKSKVIPQMVKMVP